AALRRGARYGFVFHVDHIKALAKGGSHAYDNIAVIPGLVNNHKKDRDMKLSPGDVVELHGRLVASGFNPRRAP
ncbi:MAG: hypothetical protein ACRDRT_12100, partial [Pseudonocardiaceae bacterium]